MRPPRLQALVSQLLVRDPPENVQHEIHTRQGARVSGDDLRMAFMLSTLTDHRLDRVLKHARLLILTALRLESHRLGEVGILDGDERVELIEGEIVARTPLDVNPRSSWEGPLAFLRSPC